MKTIHVIGCGHVGRTLSRLWAGHGVLDVRCVLNRSLQSALRAVEFVGSGRAVQTYADLPAADLIMISASDEAIEACCAGLCRTGILEEGTVLFHCSGSLPSTLLDQAKERGASIASIHPVKSFAEPATAVETFSGTFCAIEGDPLACDTLADLLHRCGAKTFRVEPEFKPIYHAGTVVVCNYLVALMEVGLKCFQKAGLSREVALEVIEPMVRGTVENVFQLGPVAALTGPIARGEASVVQRQCEALERWNEDIRQVYSLLGQTALELSSAQGNASADSLRAIKEILGSALQ